MKLSFLKKQSCRPCRPGTRALSLIQARNCLAVLPGWRLSASAKNISKVFIMKDFLAAIALIKKISSVAQRQDHHPDLFLTAYRKLKIVLSTHDVGGLTRNDFILAAKIEALPKALKPLL